MSKSIFKTVLFFSLFIIGFSCDNEKTTDIINILTSKFEAVVDGEQFTANTKFYIDNAGNLITGQQLEDGKIKDQIVITVPDLEVGSYSIGLDGIVIMTYKLNDSTFYTGFSGTVNITKFEDNKLSGLFDFQATSASIPPQTIHVADGVFENIPKIGS